MMTFHFFMDPGHGWLRVPRKMVEGLDISPYSYQRGDWVYLEEDDDMEKFVVYFGKENLRFIEHHTNRQSRIRSYQSYRRET